MFQDSRVRWKAAALALLAGGLLAGAVPSGHASVPGGQLRVGLVRSMFRDLPEPLVQMLMPPFSNLVYAQTGMRGEISAAADCTDLAEQLEARKLHLGVFHGIEFAWAQEKFPALRPLMIAINYERELTANLVTRNDCPATDLPALKGVKLAIPRFTRQHCWLWLERHCEDLGCAAEAFFTNVTSHPSAERALDDLVRGQVQAVLVDGVSLNSYRRIKPGCFNVLKTVKRSETFPAAVIAYREGVLDQGTLNRFRTGMAAANQNQRSRELMGMWKLTAFEPVPGNYAATLANIRRAYPAPDTRVKTAAVPVSAQMD